MGVSGDNKPLISEPLYIPVNIRKTVKSSYIIQYIFSLITNRKKLEVVNNNKHFQKLFEINIEDYKKLSGKYVIYDKKEKGKEFKSGTKILIFEGKYLNGKRNGKGKEYYDNGKLKLEGEYSKGKLLKGKGYDIKGKVILKIDSNGKGKEYYSNGDKKFVGEFLNGKKWNGKGYKKNGIEVFELKSGNGKIEEYNYDGVLIFEGEYKLGYKNGIIEEYNSKV